jgi:hypothetical protein
LWWLTCKGTDALRTLQGKIRADVDPGLTPPDRQVYGLKRQTEQEVEKMSKTWKAYQVAQSNGAYAGRGVKFRNVGNKPVEGILTRMFQPNGSPTVLLTVVSGPQTFVHTVSSYQDVEVL